VSYEVRKNTTKRYKRGRWKYMYVPKLELHVATFPFFGRLYQLTLQALPAAEECDE
jgi:hypothetical protein